MAGFSNETMYADNVNFSGAKTPAVTANGQLMIGSTVAPNIRIGTLSSSDSSLTITNGAGTISLTVTGGTTVGKTITGDNGGALPPSGGNWNLLTTGELTSSGSGSTLTFKIDGGTTGQLLVANTGTDATFASSDNADFTFGGANSGATRTLSVTNTSNTASSAANLQITTGGGTAADPQTTYTVTGATSWSTGIDNSASDAYVIAASTALGTTNVVSMATGGAVSVVLGNLDVTRSNSGGDVSATVSNTSNTASSNATQYLTVAGTSANDPRVQYAVSGTTTWTQGIDNSDSDAYVLSASSALGTTNVIHATTSGILNYPLQPAFFYYQNSDATNATGDGTAYTLGSSVALTQLFDQGNNFTTGGTFTAPVTGIYMFNFNVAFSVGASGATQFGMNAIINSVSYSIQQNNSVATGGFGPPVYTGAILINMTASQTATFRVFLQGGTKTVTINGTGGGPVYRTFVSGYLVC